MNPKTEEELMKRKILSVLLSIVMVVSMLPVTAAAAGYSDTDGH